MIKTDLVGCLDCGSRKTKVTKTCTALRDGIHYTRRKRSCLVCHKSYRTIEVLEKNFVSMRHA